MTKLLLGALALLTFVLAAAASAGAATLPSGFRDDLYLTTLGQPTSFAFAPDGTVFVAEKTGRIMVYDDIDEDEKKLFADLRKPVYDNGDRGLLSIALDPDFPTKPFVYALYTFDHVLGVDPPGKFPHWGEGPGYVGDPCPLPEGADADSCPVSGRLVRLTAESTPGGYKATQSGGEADQKPLLEDWCQQFSSHSIGDLQFAADGSLYVSGGEGANYNVPDYGQFGWPQKNMCADPPGGTIGSVLTPPSAEGGALRSQDLLTPATLGDPTGLSGTVARVDPETGAGLPGNPLFDSFDANERRIVAFGFRNPFRIALDAQNGDLYIANVGWGTYEEIDRVPELPDGEPPDSGWPCIEGPRWHSSYENVSLNLCNQLYADPDSTIEPFFFYRHGTDVLPGDGCKTENGAALAAMDVYRGGKFPARYEGALFFADTVRGCIWVMYPDEHDGRPDPETTELFLGEGTNFPGIDIHTGPEGNLYYLTFDANDGEGSLHRVTYDPASPIARIEASPEWGPVDPDPLEVDFDASGSEDPAGGTLEYEWDLNGNGSFETDTGTSPVASKTYSDSENVKVSVRVDNGTKESVARITVYPGDTPPVPEIDTPSAAHTWRVGEPIYFEGDAADEEEGGGEIDDSNLRWKTRLLHCPAACHAHPLQTFPGTDSGEFIAPDHDYPAKIELSLTATDSRGLSATTSIQLLPDTVDLRIVSDPAGLPLGAGPSSEVAPYTLRAIIGSNVVLSAPPKALIDGVEQPWLGWSDGGARVHTIVASQSGTYTATYQHAEPPPPPPVNRPNTKLAKKPEKQTFSRSARFVFSSSLAGSSFRCKLDQNPYKACRSPRVYRNLALGKHVLRVQATAADGTIEAQPALYRWRVLLPRR
ncbi:MAG TPA: PQQ-dependent sugar dehydrogenase [Solirubrobacterales bacterium]|nr:PQQ-dependent sugar dehydrogenase [Solirubrobacterales bacterium]